MKSHLLIAVLLFLSLVMPAQEKRIVIRSFSPSDIGDMRARTAPVYDNNNRLAALIEISFAAADSTARFEGILGTPVHHTGEWLVRVPEGARRIKISVPGCNPVDYVFPESLLPESGRVYKMDLDIEEAVKLRTLILSTFSWNQSQHAYGLMLGVCKNNGAYVHIKTDFVFYLPTNVDCDAEGMVNGIKGWFTGESKTSRSAVTAGYMRRLFDVSRTSSFYGFVGGGYGSRVLGWQMYGADGNYEYARVIPSSFKGYEVETGILFRLGGVTLSAGIQTNQFKYCEANMGIGVMF